MYAWSNSSRPFTPDLLRVSIEGDLNGRPFQAKDSSRLQGNVTVREVSSLINTIVDAAVVSATNAANADSGRVCDARQL
jgi:hypothetical protein